ncbi:S41 family peptidase [Chlorobium sp. KB01]|uniref:S41 family peptidase n=1 Tax=Chlorobium sp. KB01 TaxID=1917528 RepID=UPI00097706B6|nr:S41 family peptidase [Chlorobium sp. KB01]
MHRNRLYRGTYVGAVLTTLRRRVPGFMIVLCLCSSFSARPLYAMPADEKEYFGIIKSIDLLGEVYRQLSLNYVDKPDVSELMYAGIDGMLHTLDPYTVFLDKNDSKELDELTSGQYAGIGVTIAAIDGAIYIASVEDGYGAARAGIRMGDTISAVNGTAIRNKPLYEVKELLKGPLGESLTLKIEREGEPFFTATIKREEIRVNTVSHFCMMGDTGYIEMKSFGSRSADELREALLALQRQADEKHIRLKGVILDLRNNPGGLLDVAADVCSLFVKKGSNVVSIRGRTSEAKSYLTVASPVNVSLPLAVLINSQSASAAEIVAGAIQDLDRGVIIGERSYGKGRVQSVVTLSYDNTLKLTTAKYYTPSGRLIQKEGHPEPGQRQVLPDVKEENHSALFYTRGKRKVYGGGGINPDIESSEPKGSPYLTELRNKGMLFLFASGYRSRTPLKPAQPLDRKALMLLFNEYLQGRKFTYTSPAQRQLDELKSALMVDSSDKEVNPITIPDELLKGVERLKEQEIAREAGALCDALELEILRHYDRQLARTGELSHDPVVKGALEVLADSRQYSRILHP